MKNYRTLFYISVFCLTFLISFANFYQANAQQVKVDSLLKVLDKAALDSGKVNNRNELAKSMINIGDLDGAMKQFEENISDCNKLLEDKSKLSQWTVVKKALAYSHVLIANVYDRMAKYEESLKEDSIALSISEEADDKTGLGNALNNTGVTLWHQGNIDEAIKKLELAYKTRSENNERQLAAVTLGNIAAVYNSRGKYPDALRFYLQALKVHEELKDPKMISISLLNIGTIYHRQGNFNEAMKSFNEAMKGFESIGMANGIASTAINMGASLTSLKNYPEALKSYEKALPILRAMGEPQGLGTLLNNISDVNLSMGKYPEALSYQTEALQIWQKSGIKEGIIASYLTIGTIRTKQKQYAEAEKYLKDALRLAKEAGIVDELKESYIQLSNLAEARNDFDDALRYYKSYSEVKDSALNVESSRQVAEMKTLYESEKKDKEIQLLNKDSEVQQKEISRQKVIRNSYLGGFAVVLIFSIVVFGQKKKITKEKQRSDELLLNILPSETAEELKVTGSAKAKSFEQVTVLFTDFKDFTDASEKLSAEDLVREIHNCYSEFDKIVTRHGIEKIKTIGDAYMCAGGLPVSNQTHPGDVVKAAMEMQQFIIRNKNERMAKGLPFFELRIGIHTGPVVAGIVGIKKFAYDIWGDTVNTASRMESSGEVGKVNISGATYNMVKDQFACTHRGKVAAKNKGEIDMYFVDAAL